MLMGRLATPAKPQCGMAARRTTSGRLLQSAMCRSGPCMSLFHVLWISTPRRALTAAAACRQYQTSTCEAASAHAPHRHMPGQELHSVALAVGANLGDRVANIREALRLLPAHGIQVGGAPRMHMCVCSIMPGSSRHVCLHASCTVERWRHRAHSEVPRSRRVHHTGSACSEEPDRNGCGTCHAVLPRCTASGSLAHWRGSAVVVLHRWCGSHGCTRARLPTSRTSRSSSMLRWPCAPRCRHGSCWRR